MNNNITIAIDGFSSTGKSTVAKRIAKELGYVFVDTGAMYRAITLFAIENGFISEKEFNKKGLISELKNVKLAFKFNQDLGFSEMYLNGKNVEKEIRTMEVSSYVSQIATVSEVREQLVKQQQQMAKGIGVVMDGRDIGTVVFPDAELKIFMIASAEAKAERRYKELIERGDEVTYSDVLENVKQRDYIDSTRKDSPLVKADDAIKIDSSDLTLDQTFEKVMQLVNMTLEDCE